MLTEKKKTLLEGYKLRTTVTPNDRSLRRFLYADLKELINDLAIMRDSELNTPDIEGGAPGRRFSELWGHLVTAVLQQPAHWKDPQWRTLCEKMGFKAMTAEEFEEFKQRNWWKFGLPSPHSHALGDEEMAEDAGED